MFIAHITSWWSLEIKSKIEINAKIFQENKAEVVG